MTQGRLQQWKHEATMWRREAFANRWFVYGIPAALAIAALDQLSKFWIVHIVELQSRIQPCAKTPQLNCSQISVNSIFDLTYVQNYGASFGLLRGGLSSRIILSMISLGVACALAVWLGRLKRPVAAVGVMFIIGGALGNLYDRIAYGYVVDFLDFSGLYFPWVFNVADMAINVGVACFLLDAWQTRDKPANQG